jgi:hypothetical protein
MPLQEQQTTQFGKLKLNSALGWDAAQKAAAREECNDQTGLQQVVFAGGITWPQFA